MAKLPLEVERPVEVSRQQHPHDVRILCEQRFEIEPLGVGTLSEVKITRVF